MNPQPEIHRLHPLAPPNIPEHTIVRCIGSGSYGEVWLARHTSGAYHAVKVVSRQMFQRDRPFEREFTGILKYEPLSRSHEGLVDVLEVGRDDKAGVFFYVMELGDDALLGRQIEPDRYVPKTLRTEIDERGRLPFEECLRIAVGLTAALGYLHQHRLIHRDIKPSNVIFVNGHPKLADIGLVADAHEARSYVGTEGFIPPEGPGTPQADLFGLGKTIYEMATGKDRKEFPAIAADLAGSVDHQNLLELNEIILKACANDPAQRYSSAAEMLADLALLQSGRSVRQARALEQRLATASKLGKIAAALALLAAAAYFFAQIEARRARKAERTANDHLAKAYLAQARAGRMSGVPGQRMESLKAVAAAAKLQPSVQLRNEAAAALALLDLEDGHWRARPENFAFDHTLERYALGNRQGEITVYRAADDAELMRLVGSRGAAGYLQFSPDGRFLAVNFSSTRLVIWNLTTRAQAMNGKFGDVTWGPPCVFGPDGRTVGVRTTERRIRFFDLTTSAELESLPLSAPAKFFALRPDGQVLAVGPAVGNDVELWDLKSRTLHRKLAHEVPVESLAWHGDGRHLAVGGWRGHLYLWDTGTTNRLEMHGHTGVVPTVVFDHRGDVLVSSSWDGTTRFWHVGTGQQLLVNYSGYAVGFSPDDQQLAYYREGSGLGIWHVHRSTCFRTLAGPIGSTKPSHGNADLSPDGRWLLAANLDGVRAWDFASDRLVYFQPLKNTHSAHFTSKGNSFITTSFTEVREWRLMDHEAHSSLMVDQPKVLMTFPGNTRPRVTVTRANHDVMTINHSKRVLALDLDKPAPTSLLEGKVLEGNAAISPDTNCLVVSQSGTKIWDLRRREMVRELSEDGFVSFSPDGRWLIIGSASSYVLYETGSWQRRHVIGLNSAAFPRKAAFSRDGRLLALAVNRRLVQIVDPDTGRESVTLTPPGPQIISSLAFSPDDHTLLVTTDQTEVHIWDLRSLRRQLASLNLDWQD